MFHIRVYHSFHRPYRRKMLAKRLGVIPTHYQLLR